MTDERYEALSDPDFLRRYGECELTVEAGNGCWLVCCRDQVNAITHFDHMEDAFQWLGELRNAVERWRDHLVGSMTTKIERRSKEMTTNIINLNNVRRSKKAANKETHTCPRCRVEAVVVGGYNEIEYIECPKCGYYGDHFEDNGIVYDIEVPTENGMRHVDEAAYYKRISEIDAWAYDDLDAWADNPDPLPF
jgi:hypothetical protein